MKRIGLEGVLIAALMGAPVAMTQAPAGAARVVAVKAGRLLDVRTGKYAANQIIWIEGERIKEIGDAAGLESRLPKDARMVDLSNLTVLPGLIDCHTHLTMSPQTLGPSGLRMSYPRQALMGARNARVTLEAGFTTVRNVGGAGYADIALRDAINVGDVRGPRMLASGPPLSITGGHGDENFLGPQGRAMDEGGAGGGGGGV